MNLYQYQIPQRVQCGRSGVRPIFWDCGLCGAREPVLHGRIAAGPAWEQMGLVERADGTYAPLCLCEECFNHVRDTGNLALPPDRQAAAPALRRLPARLFKGVKRDG